MIYLAIGTFVLICFLVWIWCYRCDHKYFIVRNLHGDERFQTHRTIPDPLSINLSISLNHPNRITNRIANHASQESHQCLSTQFLNQRLG